ncbi:MAG: DUF5050 domain-containing protein [Clostridiaceae bacterium]|jgi:hypothetical protein|nr:DUF5050 domain-containing protein [Clostridiaceae bacterium]
MHRHRILHIRICFFLLSAMLVLAGCAPTPLTDIADPENQEVAINQGGNLHYQNLVLPISNCIVFNSADGKLSLAAQDGSNVMALNDTMGNTPIFADDWLFYTQGATGDYLMKMNLDGSNQVRIGRTPLKYMVVHRNRIYAIEAGQGTVISLATDGTDRRLLVDFRAVALALSGDRLFITGANANDGVVMVDLSSGEKSWLLRQRVSSLNVYGDWIYFADPDNHFRLTAYSIAEQVTAALGPTGLQKPFIVSCGYLYFIDPSNLNRLYRYRLVGASPLDNRAVELVIDDAVGSFAVCQPFIYYRRPASERIYRVNQDGSDKMRIT